MTPAGWETLRPVVDELREMNRRSGAEPGEAAHRDQITAAMRTFLTDLGVDLADGAAVHAILACCVAVQHAARSTHIFEHTIGHAEMVGAFRIAAAVGEVVVNFIPEGALT